MPGTFDNTLAQMGSTLTRMHTMELLERYIGRCPRCRTQHVVVFVPKGDLLMVSHPTTRLGACVICWHDQLEAYGSFEPST